VNSSPLDVSELARLWLECHGDEATGVATDMITELQKSGNVAGADLWHRVLDEIEELRKTKES
jgi:hypothetical protein